MEKASYMFARWAGGLLLMWGCGAHEPAPQAQTALSASEEQASIESEEPVAEVEEQEAPPEAEPPRSGPATLIVEVAVHNELKPAAVSVKDKDGNEVVSGKSGEPLTLQSGSYTLVVSIEDAAGLADRKRRTR